MRRGQTIIETIVLVTESCCDCGVLFAMTDEFIREKRVHSETNDGLFYCPNGHQQYYVGKSDEHRRKEAERRAASAEEEARIASIRAEQAERELKRQTRRTTNGVCPCCNRTFKQVAAHMKRMHPDAIT